MMKDSSMGWDMMLVTLNVIWGEHKHTAELVDVIIRWFFLERVGLVEEFRYVAYVCIWYVTYPLLIFEGMMMMNDICC